MFVSINLTTTTLRIIETILETTRVCKYQVDNYLSKEVQRGGVQVTLETIQVCKYQFDNYHSNEVLRLTCMPQKESFYSEFVFSGSYY
jgi:hypothetical protein